MSRRDEQGTALVELTWLGILLLIPLTYVIVCVFDVQRESFAVAGAARAAARAYTLADDDATGRARAHAAAQQVMTDHDAGSLPPDAITLGCGGATDCFAPGSVITATISSSVQLPLLPTFMTQGASRIHVRSTHSVPVGRYREFAP